MRLDPAPLPDLYALLNFDERTDERVVIDRATIEIDRLHNGDVLPELDVDDSDGAKLRLVHGGATHRIETGGCAQEWTSRCLSNRGLSRLKLLSLYFFSHNLHRSRSF